jgi:hypothetical protein
VRFGGRFGEVKLVHLHRVIIEEVRHVE